MPSSRKRTAAPSLAVQAAELAFAVPQVVGHRVARMAMAGPSLSPRDRKEFSLMVAEKHSAFAASWNAMASQAVLAQQALAASCLQSFAAAAAGRQPMTGGLGEQWHAAALGVLGKGLAPVHRVAVANSKRLAKTRLR